MTSQALPKPLETFVRKDNAHFRKELQASQAQQGVDAASPPSALVPSSPGKRKYEDLSDDEPKVSVRERGSDQTTSSEGSTLQGAGRSLDAMTRPSQHGDEVLMGVDPLLMKHAPEMRERGGHSVVTRLTSRPRELGADDEGREKTIDSMDFDMDGEGVVEDAKVAGPSAAVNNVGFVQ